jgi:histidinol phosphatase-like PHP family hydrolase
VLEGLATTGVALEVNGALDRLDATADVIRRAVRGGVDLTISTDSHHVPRSFGAWSTALNGPVGAGHRKAAVVNARPLAEFEEWVSRRR